MTSDTTVATNDIFITIFIPTAPGRQHALLNCLSRLSFQRQHNFEVIVISDGPLTEPGQIEFEFHKFYPIRVLYTQEQLCQWGHPQTETALRLMRGKWFLRVNDDNVVYPELTHAIEHTAKSQHTRIIIWKLYFADVRTPHGALILPNRWPLARGAIDMMNFAIERTLSQEVGFPFRDHSADWEFFDACHKHNGGEFTFIPDVLGEHW